ncbi:metallophosphoesterase [Streptomyces sp. HCCB10043]|nr:metallophosphoesterase [Streptomyces sp. HCCB10043]
MTETSDTRSADGAAGGAAQEAPRSRLQRLMRYIPLVAPVLLWAVPCWVLLYTGQRWPLPVALAGTALLVLGLVGMPFAMARGHGRRQQDRAAIVGDTLLGGIWVLFTWSVLLGVLLRLALTVAGVGDGQDRARIVTWAVVGVAAVLLAWG